MPCTRALRLAFAALFLLAGRAATAVDCTDYQDTIHWLPYEAPPDLTAERILAADGYLYVYAYSPGIQLRIYDLADPDHPAIVGTLNGTGNPVAKLGDVLICGGRPRLVDVSDPTAPVLLGEAAESATSLAAEGELAVGTYRSGFDDYLRVFDISDPTAPTMLSELRITGSTSTAIALANGVAYIRYDNATARVIPVSLADPINPVPLTPHADDGVSISALVARGDRLYAAGIAGAGYAFQVFDTSDPQDFLPLGSLATSQQITGIRVDGDQVVMSGNGGFQLLDISDETAPGLVGGLTNRFNSREACLQSGHVYQVGVPTDFDGGYQHAWLRAADVSSGQAAAPVGNLVLGSTTDLACAGDLAHVVGSSSYSIVSTADPANPELVGSLPLAAPVYDLAIDGTSTYLLMRNAPGDYALRCLDTTVPSAPVEVGSLALPCESASDLVVEAGRVYIGCTDGQPFDPVPVIAVVDVSDPANPQLESHASTDSYGSSETLLLTDDGQYLLQVTEDRVLTLSLAQPATPVVVAGTGYLPSNALAAGAAGDLLIVGGSASLWGMGDGVITLLDISDPTQITSLATFNVAVPPRDILVGGDLPTRTFILGDGAAITLCSGIDPLAPHVVSSYAVAAHKLSNAGGVLVGISNVDLGLVTLPYDCAITSTPEAPAVAAALTAHPNPFNPSTELRFALDAAGPVRLSIHDIAGRRVRALLAGVQPAGELRATWDGRDDTGHALASGVYLARLEAAEGTVSRKLVLLK
ncbi:T9SS type A sorting domain-containing protein [bacterium]|nr:T9SS type A sorting domain-containing protein [bacterium]